ncbi:MAG: hypothetical protein JKX83_02665 [Pseudomonadales bacterium]|nr:hypothetical protein [Pseudomonadales bacterium]
MPRRLLYLPTKYLLCLVAPFYSFCSFGLTMQQFQMLSTNDSVISYQFGYRHDELNWNIGSNLAGTFTPNILSELSWERIESTQFSLNLSTMVNEDVYFRVHIATSSIYSGENQDSDYNGNNRTLEFSRSNNNASKGRHFDAGVAMGFPARHVTTNTKKILFVPMVGYSYNRQYLTLTDGVQTLATNQSAPLGPIPGLNSIYEAQWHGPWAGLELLYKISEAAELNIAFEHHRGAYLGQANWNLRTNFQHPLSFEHEADATGNVLSVDLILGTPEDYQWYVSLEYQRWQTDAGTDRVFLSDNTIAITRLNEVNWISYSASVGVLISF